MTESVTLPQYTLGSGGIEQERLRRQADDLRPRSEELFARLSVQPGWNTLDLGCGPAGNLGLLAGLTAPGGHVTGVDVNPDHVRLAGDFAAARGMGNVTVRCADARATGLPAGSFDLVYARLLLINIPWPGDVVAEMARLARPGGWVAGERRPTPSASATRRTRRGTGWRRCSARPGSWPMPTWAWAAGWPLCTGTPG
jgi:SAM-dependent methyltransferase